MLKWLGVRADEQQGRRAGSVVAARTEDPLAAIGPPAQHVYSVSRVNPIFVDNLDCTTLPHKPTQLKHPPAEVQHVQETNAAAGADKTPSSGYGSHGGSSHEPTYVDSVRLREDAVAILEQNASFVKSILVAVQNKNQKSRRSVGSLGSSAAGTLSTIPEGRVDLAIPRPVWPDRHDKTPAENLYDSLVDESLLLYTSLSYVPENEAARRASANEILKELSDTVNAAVQGNTGLAPEQVLKCINDRLACGLEGLQRSTEEDMRKLSANLRNSEHLNTVIRAFSHASCCDSTTSSSSSSGGLRACSTDTEDTYQVPSSSSGFSDKNVYGSSGRAQLPVFVHEDLGRVPTGVRNALLYGASVNPRSECSAGVAPGATGSSANDRLLGREQVALAKGSLLAASPDAKPSVWEIYYGAGVLDTDGSSRTRSATDTPYFPAGRPEADFTLDVPRSELLMRKMKAAKKWRFRCRIVTSFLGLVFFLLSLMAVSLMLTRGKRMFGSMV